MEEDQGKRDEVDCNVEGDRFAAEACDDKTDTVNEWKQTNFREASSGKKTHHELS